jgi:hypothetical protein
LQWGVFSFDHNGVHQLHALYDNLLYANEQARWIAWKESYTYCCDFEHGCVFVRDLEEAGYTGNMAKKHYGNHSPDEFNKGSATRCFFVYIGMVDDAYSGASFYLYVRPVVVNQAPSSTVGSKSKRKRGVKQEEPGLKRVKTEDGLVKTEAEVEEDAGSDVADAASDRSSSPEIAENWPEPYSCGSYICHGGCHKRYIP